MGEINTESGKGCILIAIAIAIIAIVALIIYKNLQ